MNTDEELAKKVLRSIFISLQGYSKWNGKTPNEIELLLAIKLVVEKSKPFMDDTYLIMTDWK